MKLVSGNRRANLPGIRNGLDSQKRGSNEVSGFQRILDRRKEMIRTWGLVRVPSQKLACHKLQSDSKNLYLACSNSLDLESPGSVAPTPQSSWMCWPMAKLPKKTIVTKKHLEVLPSACRAFTLTERDRSLIQARHQH